MQQPSQQSLQQLLHDIAQLLQHPSQHELNTFPKQENIEQIQQKSFSMHFLELSISISNMHKLPIIKGMKETQISIKIIKSNLNSKFKEDFAFLKRYSLMKTEPPRLLQISKSFESYLVEE